MSGEIDRGAIAGAAATAAARTAPAVPAARAPAGPPLISLSFLFMRLQTSPGTTWSKQRMNHVRSQF